MSDITDRINNHMRSLAPHVAKRETASLLRDAMEEILRLREQSNFISLQKMSKPNDNQLNERMGLIWDETK